MTTQPAQYVVTGAAKPGIGEAITRRLIQQGHRVLGTFEAANAETAGTLSSEYSGSLELFEVDHSQQASLAAFADAISAPLAGLVHAQFHFAMEDPESLDHDEWHRSVKVNLIAPNFLTHALKPRLRRDASVVVVTSTEGYIGSFGASAYAATKAAIHNLVKTFANTMGDRGIRANAVAAGWIGGVMDTDEVFNLSRKITPLGRLGSPSEVAAVVWFLLSQESSFVNGATITADGGYTCVDTIAKFEYSQHRSNTGGQP